MAQVKYPVCLYNVRGEVKICDNDAQVASARANGFTQGYVRSEYPKMLYAKDGSTVTVKDIKEHKNRELEGYDTTYVAPAPPKAAPAASGEPPSETLRLLFAEISDLRSRVDLLEGAIMSKPAPAEEPTEEPTEEPVHEPRNAQRNRR